MATRKVTELDEIAASSIEAGVDVIPIADVSESTSFKTTPSDIVQSALNAGVTLSGDVTIDGGGTQDANFNDIATLTLDSTILNASGVESVSIASTGVGAGQGQVEIRADQELRILTPAVVAQTATAGQTLQLVDAINGIVEFGDVSVGGSYLPLAGGTMSGAINMGSQKITSLGTPTANADGSTKLYVDTWTNVIETVTYVGGAVTSINNLNSGSTTANRIVVSASVAVGGYLTLTGIVAPTLSNKLLIVTNACSVPMILSPQDTNSTAANRFSTYINANAFGSADMTLAPSDSALLFYSSSRWQFLGRIQSGNHNLVSTTSGGISVDATFCLRPGGPFEYVTAAAFNFYAIPAISTDTSTPVIELFNKTGGSVTIYYDSAPGGGTPTTWGIYTPTGANVTWPNLTLARFAYDRAVTRWRLLNTPQ